MKHDKGVAEQKDAVCNLFATFKCSLDNLEHFIIIISNKFHSILIYMSHLTAETLF